jgi:lactate permease
VVAALVGHTDALRPVQVGFALWTSWRGTLLPLVHPGTLMMVALAVGVTVGGGSMGASLRAAAWRLRSAAVALATMLLVSRLMVHAGMIDALQRAAVGTLGWGYALAVPLVGSLGSLVTGSATASNVLFAVLQRDAAGALGVDATWFLAGQGVGAAVGNIVCPHNVIAGVATVGLVGRESAVLRQTLLPCLLYALPGGVVLARVV